MPPYHLQDGAVNIDTNIDIMIDLPRYQYQQPKLCLETVETQKSPGYDPN